MTGFQTSGIRQTYKSLAQIRMCESIHLKMLDRIYNKHISGSIYIILDELLHVCIEMLKSKYLN